MTFFSIQFIRPLVYFCTWFIVSTFFFRSKSPSFSRGARPKSTGYTPLHHQFAHHHRPWHSESRSPGSTGGRSSRSHLQDDMSQRRGESAASWFQRGMHIAAYKTLLTIPKSPGLCRVSGRGAYFILPMGLKPCVFHL